MTGFDCNCYIGSWPFYYLERTSFEDVRRLHENRGVCGGVISSLQAIFHNDPYEAEMWLSKALEGQTEYRQVLCVNPMLPGWKEDLPGFVAGGKIAGVRIVPGIHGYKLNCPELQELAEYLAAIKLPLVINMRMEDPRATYLIVPRNITKEEIEEFIGANPGLTVLLSTIYPNEIMELGDTIRESDNVYADCSAIRGGLFIVEKLYEEGVLDKMVYGSMTPLFCMESSLLLIEQAQVPEETRQKVFCDNFKKIFN